MKSPIFVLYRILGNDLQPRHTDEQTFTNTKFILKNESQLSYCTKKWIINRIIKPDKEKQIIDLLNQYKQSFTKIPFIYDDYNSCSKNPIKNLNISRKLKSNYEIERYNKINYITNNNNARNRAIRDGKQNADWILPFDGNCCFTQKGWDQVLKKILSQNSTEPCFIVPLYRLTNNKDYFNFDPTKFIENEPQIIVGRKSDIYFNESYSYGMDSKNELLLRLGYKHKYTPSGLIITDQAYRCGYIVRLFSGIGLGEKSSYIRKHLRNKALDRIIKELDKHI